MSSRSSYGSSYTQDKGASYAPRASSTSSSSTSTRSSGSSTSNLYAPSGYSSRNNRYGSKPPVITKGGASNDPNTSSSAPNSGYYQ